MVPTIHTYTFSIQRSNPLPNNPVENLVFTPLPDGGYKAYLVTYNFSEVEKNTILNEGHVSVSGKSSVTPIEGVFASVMSVDNCTMQINDYYTWCSAHEHNGGEVDPVCKADDKSQHVVTMTMVCQGGLSLQPGIEGPIDLENYLIVLLLIQIKVIKKSDISNISCKNKSYAYYNLAKANYQENLKDPAEKIFLKLKSLMIRTGLLLQNN